MRATCSAAQKLSTSPTTLEGRNSSCMSRPPVPYTISPWLYTPGTWSSGQLKSELSRPSVASMTDLRVLPVAGKKSSPRCMTSRTASICEELTECWSVRNVPSMSLRTHLISLSRISLRRAEEEVGVGLGVEVVPESKVLLRATPAREVETVPAEGEGGEAARADALLTPLPALVPPSSEERSAFPAPPLPRAPVPIAAQDSASSCSTVVNLIFSE
mmetsp:Transcript_17094/g.37993  ORF Transcript_17094/g.37993 Transcript_17094/m.37993 type:complete len:216 (+) Transcript_17094:642-1289(+)